MTQVLKRAFVIALVGLAASAAPAASQSLADVVRLDDLSLSGSYLAGRSAGKRRDTGIAAKYFGRALQDDPNNPVLIERAFVLDLSAGNLPRAEEFARQVISFNHQHRMAHTVLGIRDVRYRRYEQARKHFKRAAFTPIGELTSGLLTAWTFAAEGKLSKALGALDVLDRNDAFANFKTFHSALIADYLDSPSRSESQFIKAYKKAGTSLRVVQAYGNYLARTNRRAKAREIYAKFLDNTAGNPLVELARDSLDKPGAPSKFVASAQDGMAEALFSLASALSDEQSIDVSLIYTQLALAAKPGFDVAQTLLGDIYAETKRYQAAIDAFDAIDKLSVLRAGAEIQIASNLDNLGRTDEALKQLNDLLKREPNNYRALVTRGNIQRAHEKWPDAAESYSHALAVAGEVSPRHWTLYYFRGISYERANQWNKAEQDFQKALELRPDQPAVLNYLGYSWIEMRRNLKQAVAMVTKAAELRPNDGYIVDSVGWAHYQLGDHDAAVKNLERAVQLKPQDPTINDHLGDAYWRVGRKLEAKFQWQHAKDSNPEPKDLEVIERKLVEGLPDVPQTSPSASGIDQNKS